MTTAIIILVGLLGQDAPTDDEVKAALKTFQETLNGKVSADAHIAAAKEALQVRHEKVIKAVGKILVSDTDRARTGTAEALGAVDHPASVDALVEGLKANGKNPAVLSAIAQALGQLGWERGAKPLNGYLKKLGDADVRAAMKDIIGALGKIGSSSSVDGLTGILSSLQGRRRRKPYPETNAIISAANKALQSITGGSEKNANDWKKWWKENSKLLISQSTVTWWNLESSERVELAYGEKPESKSLLVGVRMVEPPAEKEGRKKKKKKKK